MAKESKKPARSRGKTQSRIDGLATTVGNIPRFSRVALNMGISLIFVAALWLPLSAVVSGSMWVIATVVWLVAYGVGWWVLIGFDDIEETPIHPRMAWIVIFGAVCLFLLILEIIFFLLLGLVL